MGLRFFIVGVFEITLN